MTERLKGTEARFFYKPKISLKKALKQIKSDDELFIYSFMYCFG